jgi:predicted DNA-binding protein
LKAALNPLAAKVGETVTLTLTYSLPKGAKLTDKPDIKGLENLSIMDVKAVPETINIRFIVDSITDMNLGPFGLDYIDSKNATVNVYSGKLTLKVMSNLDKSPDKQQLKPIQDIIPTEKIWPRLLMWGGIALAAILLTAVLIVWYLKWRRSRKKPVAELPPHMRARKDIEALSMSGMFEKGEVKAYYFRFSEILKRYLEDIRDFPAAEYTTEEIASRVSDASDRELVVLLKRADLIKFADVVPANARKDEDTAAALAYIAATEPKPETVAAGDKLGGKGI